MKTLTLRSCLLGSALLLACGDDNKDPMANTSPSSATEGTGGTQGASTTSATDPGTTGTPTTGATTTGADASTSGTSCSFICDSSGTGSVGNECDQWVQDCPEGQKCMPWSSDGDFAWDALKCTPVMENAGQPGDACTVEGNGVSGVDSCEKGSMCWNVDPNSGQGVCAAMCVGDVNNPQCNDALTTCLISNDGVLTLCLPICDPLVQDCPGNDLCIPNPQDTTAFLCILDASGEEGQAFDPCEYINSCDKGFLCADPGIGMECDPMAIGCCLPFCDTSAMPACPGVGQECLPWYEMGQAPPGFENVGVCGLPA